MFGFSEMGNGAKTELQKAQTYNNVRRITYMDILKPIHIAFVGDL